MCMFFHYISVYEETYTFMVFLINLNKVHTAIEDGRDCIVTMDRKTPNIMHSIKKTDRKGIFLTSI